MGAVISYRFSVTRAASRRGTANSWFACARLAIFIATLLLLPTAAQALAIAPAQAETSFVPNGQANFEFELINNEDFAMSVDLYARGGLADYISLSEKKFLMKPHESRKIKFGLNFPDKIILPNSASIIARIAARSPKSNAINAYVALEFRVHVKDAENAAAKPSAEGKTKRQKPQAFGASTANIEITDARFENVGKEIAKLEIEVKNTGAEETEISAAITLGKGGVASRSAEITPVKITGGATRKLVSYVNVKGLPAGYYDTEIALRYADKIKKQLIRLQIIETDSGASQPYIYLIFGILVIFNIVFIILIGARIKRQQ